MKELGGAGRLEPTIVTPKQCGCHSLSSAKASLTSPLEIIGRQDALPRCNGPLLPCGARSMVDDRHRDRGR